MNYYLTQTGKDFLEEADLLGKAPKLQGAKRHSPKAIKARLVRAVTKRLGTSRKQFAKGVAQGELSSREAYEKGEEGSA